MTGKSSGALLAVVLVVMSIGRAQPGYAKTSHLFLGGLGVVVDLAKERPTSVLEYPGLDRSLQVGLGRFVCRTVASRGRISRGRS